MSWILVLFVHAGIMSDKDSMAMTSVPGFKTEASCQAAGCATVAGRPGTGLPETILCKPLSKMCPEIAGNAMA